MNNEEKMRFALEELNKWGKHIDNFFWQISSLLIGGTTYAFVIIIKKVTRGKINKQEDIWIVIISVIVILLWVLYLFFMKYISLKQLTFAIKIDEIEKKLLNDDKSLDILPNKIEHNYERDKKEQNNKEEETYSRLFKWFMGRKIIFKMNYFDFMLVVTFVVWLLWGYIIWEYFYC